MHCSTSAFITLTRRIALSAHEHNEHLAAKLIDRAINAVGHPPSVRITGAQWSGRSTLARSLSQILGRSISSAIEIYDIDHREWHLPVSTPDIELAVFCSAPSSIETRWLQRPRRHRMITLATKADIWGSVAADLIDTSPTAVPLWAKGLPFVVANDPADGGTRRIAAAIELTLDTLPEIRAARLACALGEIAAAGIWRDEIEYLLQQRPTITA